MKKRNKLKAIKSLLVETLVYGALMAVYAVTFLRFLSDPLAELYESNLVLYGILALVLIVIQGVFLQNVASFFLDRLRISRFD